MKDIVVLNIEGKHPLTKEQMDAATEMLKNHSIASEYHVMVIFNLSDKERIYLDILQNPNK